MVKDIPRGCEICLRGAKLVLFVTGVCNKSCFYCPLSERRRGIDVIFADELEVEDDLDVILEARSIDAEGTGVTGGDPILRMAKVTKYVRLLKGFFGKDHHVHIYTNGRYVTKDVLDQLRTAGVDELRFHPEERDWGKIALAKEYGFAVGAEMPSIPGNGVLFRRLVEYLGIVGADFLNLNQLEFCPQNAFQLKQRGFVLSEEGLASVEGSEDEAKGLMAWASRTGIELPIHYCPSSVKDAIQTRMRLKRRGKNVARPYESLDEDGILSKLVIEIPGVARYDKLKAKKVAYSLGTCPWGVGVHPSGGLETSLQMLGDIRRVIPAAKISQVAEYPIALKERFRVITS